MTKKSNTTWTRAQTTVLICLLVASAFGIASCSQAWDARLKRNEAAKTAFIEKYSCVVGQMNGKLPLSYRCDKLDGGRYLQSHDLGAMALYEYENQAPALYGASAPTP